MNRKISVLWEGVNDPGPNDSEVSFTLQPLADAHEGLVIE